MKNKMANPTRFAVAEIDNFDARHGFTRCLMTGIAVSVGSIKAQADFWRNRDDLVVLRFSSEGYEYSFVALLSTGNTVPDSKLEELGEHVRDLLLLWVDEGVDETPRTEL